MHLYVCILVIAVSMTRVPTTYFRECKEIRAFKKESNVFVQILSYNEKKSVIK